MCKCKDKISKCDNAAFCAWLKTEEGKAEILKLITTNVKLQKLLINLIGGCGNVKCEAMSAIIKAAKKELYKIWSTPKKVK